MRTMRTINPRVAVGTGVLLLAGMIAVIPSLRFAETPQSAPPPPHPSVYVQAVDILKDFVRGGDLQLGFADTTACEGAYLDTTASVPIYARLIDSMKAYGLDTTAVFAEHRTLFPIRVGSTIHSYVIFDSLYDTVQGRTNWAPVQYASARNQPR